MAYMITLHNKVNLGDAVYRSIEVRLTETTVNVTLKTECEELKVEADETCVQMPWQHISDISAVAELFDLEPVRVFKVLANMLATAYKHATAITQIIAESKG
jgi:hypothetical protein